MSKVGVVLSGGGAKGAFQVGVLQRLIEKGVKPSVFFGTSVGALNAAGMAYLGIDDLTKLWLAIKGKNDILCPAWWKLLWMGGLYSMKPLREKLAQVIKGDSMAEAVVCYVDLPKGQIHYASNLDMSVEEFRRYVEASAAIPGVMELPDGVLADGGVREQTPLKQAIKAGCDEIHVILCNPMEENPVDHWLASFPKVASTIMRVIDVMEHEVFLNDILLCDKRNSDPNYKQITLKVYAPDILLIDTLEFDPAKIRQAMEQGREAVV